MEHESTEKIERNLYHERLPQMEDLEQAALKILDQHGGDSRKAAEAIYNGPAEIRDYAIKVALKQLVKLERRRSK